ncbi:alpha-1,3-fucosyltransferase [Mesorhizobium sp. M9A.F.Ca.ET.002.03.1.2]|uniref:glycosyltransferase family 10 fucosyltransferase n=1 Tax=Mesorhizobium sp. M9A.F.Ca.ET.002.03.1.2 TaxID=2493668 RepID=UPI000F74CE95|nr:glycosyltransferase family 10 fucosyltransferase [Mesorhizobium sp. M9A.F.Ca.ET.002.03.1.2]AZN97587.1 alpha-1,3-fucosyltransferase [Mesorhizobium sp. M9A.F.Ca.ET.002.03.1.2]
MPSNAPLILFYTSFFGRPVDIAAVPRCALPVRWTLDRRRIAEATAVVFHIPDFREIGDARKYPGQHWVAWSMESRQNCPCMTNPRFMKHFDITMTYEAAADVWTPYLPKAGWWKAVQASSIPSKTERAPVVHFQSSTIDRSGRAAFTAELACHIEIDSYGRHRPNRPIQGADLGRQTKIETIARYRFCLALENSISPDYVTEKVFDPLFAGTVPIYLGAPNIDEFVPANSYIDATAFGSPAGLASYLRHLVETPQAYEAYFAWRSKPLPEPLAKRLQELETSRKCRLVTLVHQRMQERHCPPSERPSLPFGRVSLLRTWLHRWRKNRDPR